MGEFSRSVDTIFRLSSVKQACYYRLRHEHGAAGMRVVHVEEARVERAWEAGHHVLSVDHAVHLLRPPAESPPAESRVSRSRVVFRDRRGEAMRTHLARPAEGARSRTRPNGRTSFIRRPRARTRVRETRERETLAAPLQPPCSPLAAPLQPPAYLACRERRVQARVDGGRKGRGSRGGGRRARRGWFARESPQSARLVSRESWPSARSRPHGAAPAAVPAAPLFACPFVRSLMFPNVPKCSLMFPAAPLFAP
eukprot:1188800-Prorocentrum_minimum.AAC.1